MTSSAAGALTWVVLTTGNRPDELTAALDSLRADGSAEVVVICNGASSAAVRPRNGVRAVESDLNVGIPGGRDLGIRSSTTELIGFLDDDAELLTGGAEKQITAAFDGDPDLGAVTFRIVDDDGVTSRRHHPRVGHVGLGEPGEVATFLGGACAVRRTAYEDAGGYWPDLFYAHEELDLSWRLRDAGYTIHYLPDILIRHPRVEISRHTDGWRLTGRNRVMIARRNLPLPILVVHTLGWLLLGMRRAPDGPCRRAYVAGWRSGWRMPVPRSPVGWRTVVELARLGRPPIL